MIGQINLELVKSSWDRSSQVGTGQVYLGKVKSDRGHIFWATNLLEPKIFLDQSSFGPKFFVDQKSFWIQNLFELKFCLDPKVFWTQKFFGTKIFFGPKNFFKPKFWWIFGEWRRSNLNTNFSPCWTIKCIFLPLFALCSEFATNMQVLSRICFGFVGFGFVWQVSWLGYNRNRSRPSTSVNVHNNSQVRYRDSLTILGIWIKISTLCSVCYNTINKLGLSYAKLSSDYTSC